jgi:group II intron reverse transcriptase/maturase
MTHGIDGQTLDGFSLETIQGTIELMRTEQYQPSPVRRTYIPKARGKWRPLGVPSPRDKVLQECVRLILEAIYEPMFSDHSHGFRPGRSCHTALESWRRNWVGTQWTLKIDIAECFERVDHGCLLDILREKIADDRFINLIRKFLRAGYLENWVYHRTYSGTPQGSVSSPILTNVYLSKFDAKLEALWKKYSQGKRRTQNSNWIALMKARKAVLEQGEVDPSCRATLQSDLRGWNQRILQTPVYDYAAPAYTRVKFLRYADDSAVGVIGPKALADHLQEEIATFLWEELKLELNREKTQVIHVPTEKARFVGYEFKAASSRLRRRNLRRKGSPHNVVQTVRTTTGNIKLLVPLRDLSQKLTKYMAKGKPAHLSGLVNQPLAHILEHYKGVMRGWYNYYQLAENVGRLNHARYVLQYSLAKTIARKERSSMAKVFRTYGIHITFAKPNGRVVCFFNAPLTQVQQAKTKAEVDAVPNWGPRRTQTRLRDSCAICGSPERVEMHHVRHIRKRGQAVRGFSLYLAAINRKQLPVCHVCHRDIHQGRYDGESLASIEKRLRAPRTVASGPSSRGLHRHGDAGAESRIAGNLACPVRRKTGGNTGHAVRRPSILLHHHGSLQGVFGGGSPTSC